MAWTPLVLAPTAPKVVREFIRDRVNMLLHDVHVMLRMPVQKRDVPRLEFEEGLEAGCNYTTANWLLAIVSGVSTLVFATETSSKKRFLRLLGEYYPWEPGASRQDDAEDLYHTFRNPLVHALGIPTEDVKNSGVRRAPPSGSVGVGKGGHPEDRIELMERSVERIYECAKTVDRNAEGGRTLSVEGLYWGVRKMIEGLTNDSTAMAAAERFLTT